MSYNKFKISIEKGLNHNIKSRKLNIEITVEEFKIFTNKYFNHIEEKKEYSVIKIDKPDVEKVLFLLRVYHGLWVEVSENEIKVYKVFPKKFKIIKEVNKLNNCYTPKTFKTNTIMYPIKSSYGTTNKMNGISLWDNLDYIEGTELVPSVQINYDHICPVF